MSYTTFYLCLIFGLGYIFFGVESYVPVGRISHSSILIGNKIYYFGGITDVGASDDAFYLDLSQSFDVVNPPWTQIPNIPFRSSWASVASDNSNNADIYLFGGIMFDVNIQKDSFKSFVYKFNINSLSWNIPTVSGIAPSRRIEMKAISDNSGKIYIFGGAANSLVGAQTRTFFSDMITFDIADSSWSINTAVNGRATYSATLLSNGIIVYVGGLEPFNGNNDVVLIADISKILLFDTNSLTWSTKSAIIKASVLVESRHAHSAVLAPNDQIIIYGGTRSTVNDVDFNQASPDVLVLDTKKDLFEITAPNVSTNIGKFPTLTAHTANLYGNYMIVAFGIKGNITRQNVITLYRNEKIYVMDIRNFTWVNSLDLSQADNNKVSDSQSSNNDKTTIILASVLGILGGLLVLIGGFFVYRWINKRKREKDDPGFFGSNIDR
uniref:Attractin/MKLN-like beta-propeller domain-containing protein n=1 Tax=Rhizophagus irregularis (strain DAOM 181602 / DAOM 197198 / MUCL 43194) TaxID=747089 RepID=U9U034_RHIID